MIFVRFLRGSQLDDGHYDILVNVEHVAAISEHNGFVAILLCNGNELVVDGTCSTVARKLGANVREPIHTKREFEVEGDDEPAEKGAGA